MTKDTTNEFSSVQYALSHGLQDAHCEYVTNVPGSRSQELFSLLGGTKISINERVAFETCYGASLAGKRSVLTMKNVGLNASLDSYVHAVLNGIHAGLVIVLYDDVEVISSPERQDSRPLNDLFPSIWLEPNSVENAYKMAVAAPELSEKANMPIVIRITNQLHRLTGKYTRVVQEKPTLSIANKRSEFISYWTERTARYTKNLSITTQKINSLFPSVVKATEDLGVIMVGVCNEELAASTYSNQAYDLYEVQTYPIDTKTIEEFVYAHKKIVIFEQGLPYVKNKVDAILGARVRTIASYTGSVPDITKSWKTFDFTERMFEGLKKIEPSYVVGDEGQFTNETTQTIKSCLCMGSSVGIGVGLADAGVIYPFVVTGDVSFLHGGMQSLSEAIVRDVAFGVIIIDNGGAASTGGQPRSGSITDVPSSIPIIKKKYEDTSIDEFAKLFRTLQKKNELAIVHITLGES